MRSRRVMSAPTPSSILMTPHPWPSTAGPRVPGPTGPGRSDLGGWPQRRVGSQGHGGAELEVGRHDGCALLWLAAAKRWWMDGSGSSMPSTRPWQPSTRTSRKARLIRFRGRSRRVAGPVSWPGSSGSTCPGVVGPPDLNQAGHPPLAPVSPGAGQGQHVGVAVADESHECPQSLVSTRAPGPGPRRSVRPLPVGVVVPFPVGQKVGHEDPAEGAHMGHPQMSR